ncbi:MAG: hypothetical protein J1F64_04510 [Oscillospiraceae bacterium]|nr:hypothetical protein [Oscillospiraceae bacterium]
MSKYISDMLKKENISVLSEYVEEKEKLKLFDGHIITTHHRILYADKDWLKKYRIIVDEDILKTMISNQESILVSDIEDAFDESNLSKKAKHKLINLIDMSAKYKYFSTEKCKEKVEADVEFDINLLLKTKRFYSDGEKIVFYKTPKLRKMKYIVLSATADEYIYKKYFEEDRICFYNCRHAGYKGVLRQYYDHSYSRNYIGKTNDAFEKIKDITGDIPTITFKKYADCDIHFGNSEGCNIMTGEDIAVVGTPHMAEFIYKLLAHQMGGDVSDNLHYREVEYNRFKFWFHTYEDELLRRIQFWLIESELEQSVGRARLLRNDCTVHLFSDFPLEHSIFAKLK